MKSLGLFIITAALTVFASASTIEKRSNSGVLSVPLQINPKISAAASKKGKRSGTIQVTDTNFESSLLYVVELQIGTPPQSTLVQLDTGSSDLVVETPSNNLCTQPPPNPCTQYGSYSANDSTTYQYLNSNLEVSYGDGDSATGDFVLDVLDIASTTLTGFEFGVMYQTSATEGILGVGYTQIEGPAVPGNPSTTYPNLPVALVNQGYIASRAYSLYTNSDQSAAGSLLLGGIDTDKYCGNLVVIDLVASGADGLNDIIDFTIPILDITGTETTGNDVTFSGSKPSTVLLDSGTTFALLPSALVDSIWSFVGATQDPNSENLALIPCSSASSSQTVNFAFQGITVDVPLSQLVVFPDGTNTVCLFGIAKMTDTAILGDTVLSSMYVVYDLDNNRVLLAPAVFNSATDNILQITSGPSSVPLVKGSGVNCAASPLVSSSTSSVVPSSTASSSSTSSSAIPASTTSVFASSLVSSSSVSSSSAVSSSSTSSSIILASTTSVFTSSSAASPSASASSPTLFSSATSSPVALSSTSSSLRAISSISVASSAAESMSLPSTRSFASFSNHTLLGSSSSTLITNAVPVNPTSYHNWPSKYAGSTLRTVAKPAPSLGGQYGSTEKGCRRSIKN